jgi:hypothetical protein
MRLWTVHPKYLDAPGLVALWREGLLAQQVLLGRTIGYRRHPQLERFRAQRRPADSIAVYLAAVCDEAQARGYRFDRSKIVRVGHSIRVDETTGQLLYEWSHLKRKLRRRNGSLYRRLLQVPVPDPHPMFRIVAGETRSWERMGGGARPARRA